MQPDKSLYAFSIILFLSLISCAALRINIDTTHDAMTISSPVSVAVSHDGTKVFVAEHDSRYISVLDAFTGTIIGRYSLDMKPAGVAVSSGDSLLYVTGGDENGQLSVLDASTGKRLRSLSLGYTPVRPVLDNSDRFLYVPNRFDNNISVIDCDQNKLAATIPTIREPITVALTPDGGTIIIANHLPSTYQIPEYMTDGGYMHLDGYIHSTDYSVSSVLLIADTTTMRITNMIHLPNGSTGLRGICVSPDGRFAYVTHILARYQVPTTQLERGWMNTNAVSVIDLTRRKLVNTVLLDDIMQGAANPWDIACSPDGKYLVVTHAGTHEISIIDRSELHNRLDLAADGYAVTEVTADSIDVSRDLSFLTGLRTRVQLHVNGPRAIAVTDSNVFIAGYFSDNIEMVFLPDSDSNIEKGWNTLLHEPSQPTDIRLGERAFNDANFCFQSWQSCASCHPDGRADGLNWDLLNDGIGNPKNTKSLLYSYATPPVMITGVRDSAETAVRAGLKYIQFVEHPESDASAIDVYLRSLKPLKSPYLDDPDFQRLAKRGKYVFIKSGCMECHPEPLYTDLNAYNVGTGTDGERTTAFDTPTLVELWRTSPYLYNGKAKDIDQILIEYNYYNKHGITSNLEIYDRDDLICFLLSL